MKSGGQLLAACLLENGAEQGFGVPGESYLAVLDALYDVQSQFDLLICRNEGGAAYMAAAYGALTGKPGICFVTRGPGATNASPGIHTAMQNSAPMILFVGQVGIDQIGREAFQEIDYQAYFGSVAKWVVQIDDADRIPEIVARAFSTAQSGRPGPVVVALPEDMLTQVTDAVACGATPIMPPGVTDAAVDSVVQLLSESENPLILVGGRDWTAEGVAALHTVVESNQLPVSTVFRFNDLFDNNSVSYVGDAGVGMHAEQQKMIREADVILAAGIRFGEMTTGAYTLFDVPVAKQKIIHVNSSDPELGKIYQPTLAIHASAGELMKALETRRQEGTGLEPGSGWAERTRQLRSQFVARLEAAKQPGPVDMGEVSKHLREVLPTDVIVTNGAGNFTAWPNRFLTYGPSARLLAPQSGAMGFGLPAAIAAKKVHPERTVVCVTGDGDFQMNCQELGSAMQGNAQPIVLLVNNGSYGTIRMHQEKFYPNRLSGTEIENPDFVKLAESYGMHAERVESTTDFAAAFERAMASSTGSLLELVVSVEALTPSSTLSQIRDAALGAGKG